MKDNTNMTTETVTEIENFILTLGLRLAQSNSDWSECEALLGKGRDSKRKVGKSDVSSQRKVPHGIDATTKAGKAKVDAFARAAGDLNAADVIMDAEMQKSLEKIRLALKADAPKAPATK